MKKLLAIVLVLALCMSAVAFADDVKVAMITDYGDITDQSFNQTTYEACKAFAEANNLDFKYYRPAGDSTAERVAMVEAAYDDGYNTIVMPGFAFAKTISVVQGDYSDVNFIVLDVAEATDEAENHVDLLSNVSCTIYKEELAGYMAGYAAVKLGYKHLGFLGGMAVPAVVRYGYGFVQGANNAAAETGDEVVIEYVYGNQFFADADITAYMDNWYQNMNVEAVFACGGSIYASAAEAAAKVNGKVIGVDVDQAAKIDGDYGEGMTVTSAMKGLAATVNADLQLVLDGKFDTIGGIVKTMGLVSAEDPSLNYVGIPETTQFSDNFTYDDYKALVAGMANGEIVVSDDVTVEPTVAVAVNYYGTIK